MADTPPLPTAIPITAPVVGIGGPAPPPTAEEAAAFIDALQTARARFLAAALAEDGEPVSVGGLLGPLPTPEQVAEFEAAMCEANARFLAAALAEDGMPVSAGWRGPETQPKPRQELSDSEAPRSGEIVTAPT